MEGGGSKPMLPACLPCVSIFRGSKTRPSESLLGTTKTSLSVGLYQIGLNSIKPLKTEPVYNEILTKRIPYKSIC